MSTKYKIYHPDAVYFITFSTVQCIDIFTRDCYREIVSESLDYCLASKGLIIYAWVLMTNHVHLICRSNIDSNLNDILRDLKKFTAVQIIRELTGNYQERRKSWLQWPLRSSASESSSNKNYQVWQHDNHPIELDTTFLAEQKINYIHHNPVRAGFVISAEAWQYSSARDYAGEKGFVNICPA